jgi:hypothetical protein
VRAAIFIFRLLAPARSHRGAPGDANAPGNMNAPLSGAFASPGIPQHPGKFTIVS